MILATKLRHGDANTVMAEGGIQGADHEVDSPYFHFLDTLGGGHFTNRPYLVAALTRDAPLVIAWLEKMGMMFDKHPDGRMLVRHGGGTSRKRMHSAGDMTGSEIMRVLRDEVRNRADADRDHGVRRRGGDPQGRQGAGLRRALYNLETEEYFVVRPRPWCWPRAATAGSTSRASPPPTTTGPPPTAW